MKWIFLLATLPGLLAAESAASADCPPPGGAVNVAIPSGLPSALRDTMGEIALPGEPFDTTDVYVKGHKHRRYLFVWNMGSRWIVATEAGGIALLAEVAAYDLGKDGKSAKLIRSSKTSPAGACAAATRLVGK